MEIFIRLTLRDVLVFLKGNYSHFVNSICFVSALFNQLFQFIELRNIHFHLILTQDLKTFHISLFSRPTCKMGLLLNATSKGVSNLLCQLEIFCFWVIIFRTIFSTLKCNAASKETPPFIRRNLSHRMKYEASLALKIILPKYILF